MREMRFTYDGNHPDHDVREEGDPDHTEEERDQVPVSPLFQTAVGHGVIADDTQRKTNAPHDPLPSIT